MRELVSEAIMESLPGFLVGRPNCSKKGNARLNRGSKATQQAASKALGTPEPIDYYDVSTTADRAHDRGLGIEKTVLIQPTTARAGASVIPDIECLPGAQIGHENRLGTLIMWPQRRLQDAADAQSAQSEFITNSKQEYINGEPARIPDCRKRAWLILVHQALPYTSDGQCRTGRHFEGHQPILYSCDLKLKCFTASGAEASLRMFPQVCL